MGVSGVLVIGGDGLLGSAIADCFRQMGENVVTTSRKKTDRSYSQESTLFLDLSKDITQWTIPIEISSAFLCASVTNLEHCRTRPDESRLVNVTNTLLLARRLVDRGVFVVYPSSNLVFDGAVPFAQADTPRNPLTEYGRQKAHVEEELLGYSGKTAVIRFSKIIAPGFSLVDGWLERMWSGKIIHPFSDMVVSPVSIALATKVCCEVGKKKLSGIWQVSAKDEITYEEFARYLALKRGLNNELVQPVKAIHSGIVHENIPRHSTLDTTRIERELGFRTPTSFETVDEMYATSYIGR